MADLSQLLAHWGHAAIFVVVVFGNAGVPVPEEAVLGLAGYLVWRGQLRLSAVLAVGIASAVTGDNLGYWLGRRYGRKALPRYMRWMLGPSRRLDSVAAFVARRGPVAVFLARSVPGLRFLPFFAADLLGALLYVPVAVGAGYAVGYGLGEYVERLRRVVGNIERIVVGVAVAGTLACIAWRTIRALRDRPNP